MVDRKILFNHLDEIIKVVSYLYVTRIKAIKQWLTLTREMICGQAINFALLISKTSDSKHTQAKESYHYDNRSEQRTKVIVHYELDFRLGGSSNI